MPTAEVVELKEGRTLREAVLEDIESLPVCTQEGEKQRETTDYYSVGILLTEYGSRLEKFVLNAAASMLRGRTDRIIRHPNYDDRATIHLRGGKFKFDEDKELIERFETRINLAIRNAADSLRKNGKLYSGNELPTVRCIYFCYHNKYNIPPEEFANIVNKMLDVDGRVLRQKLNRHAYP